VTLQLDCVHSLCLEIEIKAGAFAPAFYTDQRFPPPDLASTRPSKPRPTISTLRNPPSQLLPQTPQSYTTINLIRHITTKTMSATAVTIPPTGSYPPTPPNTIETRSRATSNVSNLSRALSEPLQSPSILVNGDAPRHQGPPRNVAFVNFPRVLSQIQEENPGYFYEAPTGVPDNTPAVTEAPSTPRSQTGPTTFDLPRIDERLDELPELVESKLGSPVPSVFGGSTDNQSKSIVTFFVVNHRCPALSRSRLVWLRHLPLATTIYGSCDRMDLFPSNRQITRHCA
jgi:hypothetical protein